MAKEQLKFSFMDDIEEVLLMKHHKMCPFCEKPETLFNIGKWCSNFFRVKCCQCKREYRGEPIKA
jgi:hypothetical protein